MGQRSSLAISCCAGTQGKNDNSVVRHLHEKMTEFGRSYFVVSKHGINIA